MHKAVVTAHLTPMPPQMNADMFIARMRKWKPLWSTSKRRVLTDDRSVDWEQAVLLCDAPEWVNCRVAASNRLTNAVSEKNRDYYQFLWNPICQMRDSQIAPFVTSEILPRIPKKYRGTVIEREIRLQIAFGALELTFAHAIPRYTPWFLRLLDVMRDGHMVVGCTGKFPREKWYVL